MTAVGRALMAGLVDYAGLFPPARLDTPTAVRRYREYLTGEDGWALGRFVVPAVRLGEFEAAFEQVCCGEREPVWGLSVLSSGDAKRDAAAVEGLARGAVSVDSLEVKARTAADAERVLRDFAAAFGTGIGTGIGTGPVVYAEFAPGDAEAVLPVVAGSGARAKIRTGGVVAEAFPSVEAVADFLLACARARVPFKATAGLHHAVRGSYRLTYEAESARAVMHGFANVFLAAALAWRGAERRAVVDTLTAREFSFREDGACWLGFELGAEEIRAARREFAMSYGSCSFTEPIAEARALGWI
ncbi:MAG: hypothetical protein WAM66_07195 [Acidobacteriaceae bacterium]